MSGEDAMMMKIDVEVELLSFPVLWFRVGPPERKLNRLPEPQPQFRHRPFTPFFSQGRLSGVSRNLALFAFVLTVSDILQSQLASSFVNRGTMARFQVLIY